MSRSGVDTARRFLAPEVIQTSAMDCGPAALTSLLEGFGIRSSYRRLQAACQTDLDGTSIDTLEEMAVALGLEAEQIMIPADHLILTAANALPAVAVVTRERTTHFVIVWRRHGRLVQVMDPEKGRRWLAADALQQQLYLHRQQVPAHAWRAWAASPEFQGGLLERLTALRVPASVRRRLVRSAVDDESWRSLALLDAATRMVAALVRGGGLRAGVDAGRVTDTIARRAREGAEPEALVPDSYWFVTPGDQEETLVLRGAVLLRALGRRTCRSTQPVEDGSEQGHAARGGLPAPLTATEPDPPARPVSAMWRLVCDGRPMIPALLALGVMVAAGGALFEVVWLRGLLEVANVLGLREQRLAAVAMLLGFVASLMLLDVAIAAGVLRIGRRVEARLRAALLEKLPRLGDNYFQGRLVSDLAHRAHSLDGLRGIPELGARFVRASMQLIFTAGALAWLDPPSAGIAAAAAVCALAIPVATEQVLSERELRQRSHSAALTRLYLDGLLGLIPIRMHAAERPIRHQHEQLLVEWGRSSLQLLRGTVVIEGFQLLMGSLLAAWLVLGFAERGARPGSTLLVVYWALTLPLLARELAAAIRQFPAYRNVLARILEPMDAPEESGPCGEPAGEEPPPAVGLTLRSVQVQIRGRRVLDGVDLDIRPGEHVAVVGCSGAGKSTLAGLLLGWRIPSAGVVLADGEPLDRPRLAALRRATAWVDPSVYLWNQSLFDNLRYGDRGTIVGGIASMLEDAELGEVLEKLPAGLQSPLGEGGRLLSGGEGQRVRFGRALGRQVVRLAVLDEPFRGLDRRQRHELLSRAREIWRDQTMLCITHDIEETLAFERVLVLEGGCIVEDGSPTALAAASDSAYGKLLAAERAVRTTLWTDGRWRRWRLENGGIVEDTGAAEKVWMLERPGSHGR